jgi:hypothetical protein
MRIPSLRMSWAPTVFLLTAVLVTSPAAQQATTLVIAGQSGSAKIIRVEGRNYVEVEGLARLMNSSMSFNGNQIVLTMPGSTADTPAPAEATGFSKDFVTAGIEAMALVREWHAALGNAIQRGYPLSDDWLNAYRNKARQALRLASVAVTSPADKSAFPFLTKEFNNMQNLSNKYVQLTVSRAYIDPNSLDSDPLDQKFLSCGHSLASMATTNQFVDDGSCQ